MAERTSQLGGQEPTSAGLQGGVWTCGFVLRVNGSNLEASRRGWRDQNCSLERTPGLGER